MTNEDQGPSHPLLSSRSRIGASAASPGEAPPLLGQGMAKDMVSLAAAMAVQDAGNYFRQVASVSAAAVAVFTAKMAENATTDPTGEPWATLIGKVNTNMQSTSSLIQQVGTDAASVIQSFSSTPSA